MQKLANQAGLRVDNGLDLETNLPKSVKNNKILTALYMFKVRLFFLLKISKHHSLRIVTPLKVRSILRQFMKNMTIRADIRKMNKVIRSVFIV